MADGTDETLAGWTVGFAEDIDLAGWVPLPDDLTDHESDLFVAEVSRLLHEVMGKAQSDPPPPTEAELRPLVREGLAARAESDSALMYQVWPVSGAAFVLCHVNFVRPADLPDWSQMPGVLRAADARHLGPGLQYSSRRRVEDPDGDPLDVNAVHLIFADDEVGLMVGLEEAPSYVISQALVGLSLFTNALTLIRADGTTFAAKPPAGILADSEWALDNDGKP